MRQLGVFTSHQGAGNGFAIVMLGGFVLVVLVCMIFVVAFARHLLSNNK
jgi:hypothetical protein